MIGFLALALLVGLVLWAVGGVAARLVGGLLALSALARLVLDGASAATLLWLAAGIGLWLFGHWHHAAKHRVWRSMLALRVWSLPVMHQLAPIPTDRRPSRRSSWPEHPAGA